MSTCICLLKLICSYKSTMETWPNFFIVGTAKAGTFSLYEHLKQIPKIWMSKVKEPKYFAPFLCNKFGYLRTEDKKEYLDLFKDAKNSLAIGECSTIYLRDPGAAKLIHDQIPHAKIIISLRDPIETIYSLHLMNLRRKYAKKNFHDVIKISLQNNYEFKEDLFDLKSSLYYEDVKRYLDVFGKNQVKIIIFEEWNKNTKQTVQDILNFLQVDFELGVDFDDVPQNQYYDIKPKGRLSQIIIDNKTTFQIARKIIPKSERRFLERTFMINKKDKKEKSFNVFKKLLYEIKTEKPEMNPQDRELLIDSYKDDVENLENLLGRKLPWPNFQK